LAPLQVLQVLIDLSVIDLRCNFTFVKRGLRIKLFRLRVDWVVFRQIRLLELQSQSFRTIWQFGRLLVIAHRNVEETLVFVDVLAVVDIANNTF
jgi:hypothetical protein